MKLNHLMLTSVLALALLGSAACSSAEDASSTAGDLGGDPPAGGVASPTEPSSGVVTDPGAVTGGETKTEPQPVVGGGDPESVDEVLAGLPETKRVNYQILEDACGKSASCLEDVNELKSAAEDCADCPPSMANFNNDLTSAQLRNGDVPTTYPQVKDVVLVNESAGDSGADAGDAGAAPGTDTAIDDIVAKLNEMGDEETDWTSIVKMADPAEQAAVEQTVKDALADMTDDETAKALLAGEKVPASEAATVIDSATNP